MKPLCVAPDGVGGAANPFEVILQIAFSRPQPTPIEPMKTTHPPSTSQVADPLNTAAQAPFDQTTGSRRGFFKNAVDKGVALGGSALLGAGVLGVEGCASAPGASQEWAQGQANNDVLSKRSVFQIPQVYLPVVGSASLFPVRRIYCIGRNYAAHSREMGSDPTREPPFFFQKPADAVQLVPIGVKVDHPYPALTKNYHYEAELIAAIGVGGRDIKLEDALSHVWGYTLGLDMTRRDLQQEMGNQKKPWEIGKSFDHSAPMGPLHKLGDVKHFTQGAIWLKVNGVVKQSADLSQMIWSVAEQIVKLSQAFELFPGDLIYSGTPENVGPVVRGDLVEMHIDGLPNLTVKIV
jgi:2-keto-4-pentenoate hydratase/2-oxohepta-3-ene-1,7-dioic acid hydratase in catechol pathway